MKIALLAPVRDRPLGIHNFYDSVVKNTKDPSNLTVVFGVDEDDKIGLDAVASLPGTLNHLTAVYSNSKMGPGTTKRWNHLLSYVKADVYGPGSNDSVFSPFGWDDMVREAFLTWPDRIGLVYGNDIIHGEEMSTHFFLSSSWVNALGHYVLEEMHHYFVDIWNMDLAKQLGRLKYIPEFITDHQHSSHGKRPLDEVDTRNVNANWKHDIAYYHENKHVFSSELDKLKAVMNVRP
jgi:hypothetical protein